MVNASISSVNPYRLIITASSSTTAKNDYNKGSFFTAKRQRPCSVAVFFICAKVLLWSAKMLHW